MALRQQTIGMSSRFQSLILALWDVEDFVKERRRYGNRIGEEAFIPFMVKLHMLIVPPPHDTSEIINNVVADFKDDAGEDQLVSFQVCPTGET